MAMKRLRKAGEGVKNLIADNKKLADALEEVQMFSGQLQGIIEGKDRIIKDLQQQLNDRNKLLNENIELERKIDALEEEIKELESLVE